MRIVATEKFLMAARAAGRTIETKVYIRGKIARDSDLSGPWTDVTDRVSDKDLPSYKNDLEINLSQFSASRIKLTGLGLAWWELIIFSYANYLEVKVDYIVSGITAEPVTVFAGWIEKKKDKFVYRRFESVNRLTFEVWSYIDYADDIYASTLLRQYINDNVDGSGTDRLALPHIKDLFVTNANVSGFVLKKGIHPIGYQVSGSDKQAKLDDGDWVTLSTGLNTLINKSGDQKITVYAKSTIPTSGEFTEDIIVDSPGDTLPKNWYTFSSVHYLLKKLFEKAGITSVSFDTLEYPTKDGNPKVSFVDFVADQEPVNATRTAVVSDGTDLWFGINNKLYKRDSTGTYTLKQTLTAGYTIRRLLYNSRNGHLWLLVGSTSVIDLDKIYAYIIGSDTMSTVASVAGACASHSATLIDYNYTGSSFKYALLITDNGSSTVDEVTIAGTTLTRTTIYSGAVFNLVIYTKNANELYFVEATGNQKIHRMHVDGSGAWVDDGAIGGGCYAFSADSIGAYNYTDDYIYFHNTASDYISYFRPTWSFGGGSLLIEHVVSVYSIISDGNDNVFACIKKNDVVGGDVLFYKIENAVATDLVSPNKILTRGLSYSGTTLWGIDSYCRLFKYATSISLFVETANCKGMKVRAAIEKACASFNLVYKISSTKTARVQRRSDENGDVVTTGDVISLNGDNVKDITDDSFYGDAYDVIKVGNGKREVNYDGTIYDAVVFDQEKVHSIDSDWIPDEILEDIAFNAYPFYSVPHKVFLAPSPTALIQYECLDGATIVYEGNMSINKAGVIVSDSVEKPPGGRPEFKILVNA